MEKSFPQNMMPSSRTATPPRIRAWRPCSASTACAHTGLVLQRLLKAQDTDSIKDLLALDVLDSAAFAEGAALAAKADNAAAAALLADAEHKKRGSAPKKRRYDFDF